ncbi:MAG: translocation/assembly module TamB domain-containing protein [Alphaproteobacteria bacterium]
MSRRRPWLYRPWLWIPGLGLALLLLAAAFAHTPPGRTLLADAIGQALSTPHMTARVEGLSGLLPFSPAIARLSLSDAGRPQDGPWLVAEDLSLSVRPLPLLGGRLDLPRLYAATVTLHRPPPATASTDSAPDPAALLDQARRLRRLNLTLPRVVLTEAVAGQPMVFALDARLHQPDGVATAHLSLSTRGDGAGDGSEGTAGNQVAASRARLDWDGAAGRFDLDVDLRPAFTSGLARGFALPLLDGIALRLTGSGDTVAWAGDLSLHTGAGGRLSARLAADLAGPPALRLDGQASAFAGLPAIAPGLPADFTFTAAAVLDPAHIRFSQATLDAPDLQATLVGAISRDLADSDLRLTVRLSDDQPFRDLAAFGFATAAIDLHATGPLARPALDLSAELDGASLAGMAIGRTTLTASTRTPAAGDAWTIAAQATSSGARLESPWLAFLAGDSLQASSDLRLAADGGRLRLASWRLATLDKGAPRFAAHGDATVDFAGSRFDLLAEMQVTAAPTDLLPAALHDATADGTVLLQIAGGRSAATISGRLMANSDDPLVAALGRAVTLSAELRQADDGVWQADDVRLDSDTARLTGRLHFDPAADHLAFSHRLDVAALPADLLPAATALGGLTLAGDLTLSSDDLNWSGAGELRQVAAGPIALARLNLSGEAALSGDIHSGRLTLTQPHTGGDDPVLPGLTLVWRGDGAGARFDATAAPGPVLAGTASATLARHGGLRAASADITRADLALLTRLVPVATTEGAASAEGIVSLTARLTPHGESGGLRLTLDAAADHLALWPGGATGQAPIIGAGRVGLTAALDLPAAGAPAHAVAGRLDLQASNASLAGVSVATLSASLDGAADGFAFALDLSPVLAPADPNRGPTRIAARGQASATGQRWAIALDRLSLAHGRRSGELTRPARLVIAPDGAGLGAMELADLDFAGDAGRLSASFAVSPDSLAGTLDLADLDLALLELVSPGWPLAGRLDAALTLAGTPARPLATLRLGSSDLHGVLVSTPSPNVTPQSVMARLDASLDYADGALAVDISASRIAPSGADISDEARSGNASSAVALSDPARPDEAASATAAPSTGLAIADTHSRDDDTARLDRLTLAGTVPLDFAIDPFVLAPAGDRALALTADGTVSAGWLGDLLLGPDHRLAGRIELTGRAEGTPDNPRLDGRMAMADGAYINTVAGLSLTALNASVVASESTAQVQLTSQTAGGGALEASGHMRFAAAGASNDVSNGVTAGLSEPVFDVRIGLDEARLVNRDEVTALASGALSLAGPLSGLRLSGALVMEPVEVSLAGRLPPGVAELAVVEIGGAERPQVAAPDDPASDGLSLALDLTLQFPRRLFVRGLGLDSEWQGALEVSGDIGQPLVDGDLAFVRGSYSFAGRAFSLDGSTIQVRPVNGVNQLSLGVRATRQIPGGTAIIDITGPPSAPQLAVSSDPPLPQEEVLSRVIFDRASARLTAIEAAQLAQSAAALSGSGGAGPDVLGWARQILGVDQLDITPGDGNGGGPGLRAGRYVGEGIFIGARQGTDAGSTAATVEIEVTPNISLESDVGQTGSGRVGFLWNWSY